ncbi:hypothetical protein Tco_0796337 [Tanacetum coccineum]
MGPTMSPGKVARERIPFELFRSIYPWRQVARETYPQRQVARDIPDLSLGNMTNVVVINLKNIHALILTHKTIKLTLVKIEHKVLQPKISRKPATPSFRSSSYGTKQSKIPLSPANYASMHPRKENMLTPITKNSTALDSIDKRRAAQISLYTLMNSGSVKAACKSNSAASRKIESTVATPSAHSTHKRCARPAKTPSKVTNRVNNQPMATPSKITKATYKQPVATPSKEKAEIEFRRLRQSFCFKARPLPSFYNERASPKSPLEKEKEESEFRRLRQSFCFKARPLPNFYIERATPKSPLKKTPPANLKSLIPARKPPTTISQPSSVKKSSRRLWKTSDQNLADHPLSKHAALIDSEDTHYLIYTISQPSLVKKSSRRLWKTSDQNRAHHPLSKYAALIDSEDTHYPIYR